jgi:hypothetical protein
MIDLNKALEGIQTTAGPDFFVGDYAPEPAWTHERLVKLLDSTGEKYKTVKSNRPDRDGEIQHSLEKCPLCKESEGNPAVWLHNGVPCFKCFRAKHCGDKTFADLLASFKRPKAKRVNALDLARNYSKPRASVVEGVMRRGDVVNIVGGPKARKSFLVALLAICVAAGIKFLCWATVKSRVLLIDNELQGDDLARRLMGIAESLGLDWPTVAANIDVMKLRGTLADLYTIRDELKADPGGYSLVIVDALYKSLPADTDENSNSDMTRAYVVLDNIAETNECATTVVHHTSKGVQSNKAVSDMGAGAGAQSRSADAHIVLREHEDEDTISVHAIVRSLPPIKPVCIQFDWPLWRLAPDKDPQKIAIGPNRKATVPLDTFVAAIPTVPTLLKLFRANVKDQFKLTRDTLDLLLEAAKNAGLVEIGILKSKGSPQTIRRTTP